MYGVDRQVDLVEQLAVILDWHAWINHSIHLSCLCYPSIYLSTHLYLPIYPSIHFQSTYMYGVDRQVDVVEQLAVVLDWHAWIKHSIHLHLVYPIHLFIYLSTSTYIYLYIHTLIYLNVQSSSVYSHVWSWQAGRCSWAARCGTWPTCRWRRTPSPSCCDSSSGMWRAAGIASQTNTPHSPVMDQRKWRVSEFR